MRARVIRVQTGRLSISITCITTICVCVCVLQLSTAARTHARMHEAAPAWESNLKSCRDNGNAKRMRAVLHNRQTDDDRTMNIN